MKYYVEVSAKYYTEADDEAEAIVRATNYFEEYEPDVMILEAIEEDERG